MKRIAPIKILRGDFIGGTDSEQKKLKHEDLLPFQVTSGIAKQPKTRQAKSTQLNWPVKRLDPAHICSGGC
jgi:hypothetical protein